MKPAAVLIVAFEVQVGFGAARVMRIRVRAAQHMPEGRARVEPDFEDVGAFAVVRCVFGTQYFFGGDAAPGFDAARFDDRGRAVEDFHRARMQFSRILVQEKRNRHAPTALPADAPVGPVRDHVVQTRLAVLGIKAGLLDRVERHPAQCFGRLVFGENAFAFVHSDEPLRSRAVDHRALVAPAMRVAVRNALGGHKPARIAQGLDDLGHRFPDVLAAEEGEIRRIAAVALHRIQNVVDREAMRAARVEVVHAISRRRMHDAGAIVGGGVVGQIHRSKAVIARIDRSYSGCSEVRGLPSAAPGATVAKTSPVERITRQGRARRAPWPAPASRVRRVDQRVVNGSGPTFKRLIGWQWSRRWWSR